MSQKLGGPNVMILAPPAIERLQYDRGNEDLVVALRQFLQDLVVFDIVHQALEPSRGPLRTEHVAVDYFGKPHGLHLLNLELWYEVNGAVDRPYCEEVVCGVSSFSEINSTKNTTSFKLLETFV